MDTLIEYIEADREDSEPKKLILVTYLRHEDDITSFSSFHRHMSPLRNKKVFDSIIETVAGEDIQEDTKRQIEQSDIIILFLSASLESDVRYNNPGMRATLKACHEKGIRIWPILAKFYHWKGTDFTKYGMFSDRAIASINNQDEFLGQMVTKIDGEVTQMLSEKWADDGDTFYYRMQLEEASAAYNSSLSNNPECPYALLGKWRVLNKQGYAEEAKRYSERILAYDISLSQAEKDTAWSGSQMPYLMRAHCKALLLLELGRVDAAHEIFRRSCQQLTSSTNRPQRKLFANLYSSLGDTSLRQGNCHPNDFSMYYEQALEAFRRADKLSQDDPSHLCKIGALYLALDKRLPANNYAEESLKIYQQVIDCYPDSTLALVGQGNVHYHLKNFDEALVAYETAVQNDQRNLYAYSGKGYTLLEFNRLEDALSAFEQALLLDDRNASAYYGKGQALALLQQYDEAEDAYVRADRCGIDKSASFLIHYALTLKALGDAENSCGQDTRSSDYYTRAVNYYEDALRRGERKKEIRCRLGEVYFASKSWGLAIISYELAILLDPQMAEAHVGLGKTHIELEEDAKAIECFKKAQACCEDARLTKDMFSIETACGAAYYLIAKRSDPKEYHKLLEEARLSYERATRIRADGIAYLGLGKTYNLMRYDKEAIAALDTALKLMPQLSECYLIKGLCYHNLGQYSDACTMYEAARDAGFKENSLQKAWGIVLLTMNRYAEAVEVFDDVIKYYDNDVVYAYLDKGFALHRQEMDGEAVQSFINAYKIDCSIQWDSQYRSVLRETYYSLRRRLHDNPRDAASYWSIGCILMILNEQIEEAIQAYTLALDYGRISADVHIQRGDCYERIYEYQKALEDYDEALRIRPGAQRAYELREQVKAKLELQKRGSVTK